MSKVVVVVADEGVASQFVRSLTQVCGTVPADVDVIGVSARFPRLPTHLSSRVEQVRVREQEAICVAVDDLVTGEAASSVVITVAARALLRTGWFEAAVDHASHLPHQIGVFGVGAPRLLRVLPGGVAPSRLTSYPLESMPGVTEEPRRFPAAGPVPAARIATSPAAMAAAIVR